MKKNTGSPLSRIDVLQQSSGGYDENLKPKTGCSYKVIQTITCEVHFPNRSAKTKSHIDKINSGESVIHEEIIRFWLYDTDNLAYIYNYEGKYIDWCGYFWKIIGSDAIEVQPCCYNVRWIVQRIEPRDDKLIEPLHPEPREDIDG